MLRDPIDWEPPVSTVLVQQDKDGKEYVCCTHDFPALVSLFVRCPNASERLPVSMKWGYRVFICRDCLYYTGQVREFLDTCLGEPYVEDKSRQHN